MERNLTQGSVFHNIIVFSLPYLLSYFLQTLYGMADLFIIGQFEGVASTTAVSVGSQVMHMLTVIIVGLSMGSTVSIGQAVGAGDRKGVSASIGNTALLFLALSAVLTLLLLLFVRPLTALIATPAEAVSGTVSYLTICFLGIPFITAYNIISSIFRGLGDSQSPLYFIAAACLANIALDYLFIGALGMGAAGAALATTLAQALSAAIALVVILGRKSGISLGKSDLRPQKAVMGRLLRIGAPIAVQDGFIQVSFMIITVIANMRGLNDAAAVGIVEKFISFLFLVPSSMLSTVSALGAQNIGAGKADRAKRTLYYACLIAIGFGVLVTVICWLYAEPIVAAFTDESEAGGAMVVLLGGQYLRGYVFDCIFAGIHFSFSGYFCACGKSLFSFLHNIAAILLVRVPGAYLTSQLFPHTLLPMGLATAAGSLLSALICLAIFRFYFRRSMVL